jgi:hypothetical protein
MHDIFEEFVIGVDGLDVQLLCHHTGVYCCARVCYMSTSWRGRILLLGLLLSCRLVRIGIGAGLFLLVGIFFNQEILIVPAATIARAELEVAHTGLKRAFQRVFLDGGPRDSRLIHASPGTQRFCVLR